MIANGLRNGARSAWDPYGCHEFSATASQSKIAGV
jgi:hypothetical protein